MKRMSRRAPVAFEVAPKVHFFDLKGPNVLTRTLSQPPGERINVLALVEEVTAFVEKVERS